jgi:hypothetical protein
MFVCLSKSISKSVITRCAIDQIECIENAQALPLTSTLEGEQLRFPPSNARLLPHAPCLPFSDAIKRPATKGSHPLGTPQHCFSATMFSSEREKEIGRRESLSLELPLRSVFVPLRLGLVQPTGIAALPAPAKSGVRAVKPPYVPAFQCFLSQLVRSAKTRSISRSSSSS